MKLKCKWNTLHQSWELYCPEHDMYTVYSGEVRYPVKPHDMAKRHLYRYHRA
jgi:hypothetical protein